MSGRPRGKLRQEFWVSCGGCGIEKCTGECTSSAAWSTMTSVGWKYTRAAGWLCPGCEVPVPAKYKASRDRLATEVDSKGRND